MWRVRAAAGRDRIDTRAEARYGVADMRAPNLARTGLAVVLLTSSVRAQSRLGPAGAPITTSNYAVDLFQGPVLATARITGIAGAYVAIGEGTEGIAFNPASASHRPVFSTTYVDYDATAGATLASSLTGTDFDNDGRKGFQYDKFVWASAGGTLQIGKFGMGAVLAAQNYELGKPSGGSSLLPGGNEAVDGLIVRVLRLDAVASYGFFDSQLHLGAGPRIAALYGIGTARSVVAGADGSVSLGDSVGERQLFATQGIGAQAGMLWTPHTLPLRAGVAVRSPILSGIDDNGSRIKQDANGNRVVGDFYLPRRVDLPWEIEWGASWQLGKRAYNGRWQDEDKLVGPEVEAERRTDSKGFKEPAFKAARRILQRRAAALPRPILMMSTAAIVTGPVTNGVGFESMLEKRVQRSGERATLGLRIGAEAEVVPRWVILRLGSYLEPTRYRASPVDARVGGELPDPQVRLHGTAGAQVKLFTWDVFKLFPERSEWRISLSGDVARQYFGWGFGLGLWH